MLPHSCHSQVHKYCHVYRFPLKFSGTSAAICMCDCGAMQHAWETLPPVDTSGVAFNEFQARLQPCLHSVTIQALHDSGRIPYGSCLDEPASSILDVNFSSLSHPFTILQSSARHLLLSCDFGSGEPCDGGGFTRVVVETDRNRHFRCTSCPPGQALCCEAHIGPLTDWLEEHSDLDYVGEMFEGFSTKESKAQHSHPSDEVGPEKLRCVSNHHIAMDFKNGVTMKRSLCGESCIQFIQYPPVYICVY
jgi:hypothetical protein